MKFATIAILFITLAQSAVAQNNNRVAIGVDFSGKDSVGRAFVYAIQDQLSRSGILENGSTTWGLVLSIVSVNDNPQTSDANNTSSAISVVLLGKRKGEIDWFIDQWVYDIGMGKTEEMAKRLLVAVNDDVNTLRQLNAR
jgi:hypothetical protein